MSFHPGDPAADDVFVQGGAGHEAAGATALQHAALVPEGCCQPGEDCKPDDIHSQVSFFDFEVSCKNSDHENKFHTEHT